MKTIVIGGGAAGMMAAAAGAAEGEAVTLLEKNEKLGKKLFITGKGRCNLTNACDVSDFFSRILTNPKFLYSALYRFTNSDVMDFFESRGVPLKTERGGRVFPLSDKSSDIIRCLENECRWTGVSVRLNTKVRALSVKGGEIKGAVLASGEKLAADRVIMATGGMSYPATGSDGDGFRILGEAGHSVAELRPGLTGFHVAEHEPRLLMGLTLKNVSVRIASHKKNYFDGFGEVLFTHYGVSGPLMLSASSEIGDRLEKETLVLHIDMKPALEWEKLDKRLLNDFNAAPNQNIKNALVHLLPKSMIPVILSRSGILPDRKVNSINRGERRQIADTLKDFRLTLTRLRGFSEAIITRGGIRTAEINPQTMESKIIRGLYLAGEVIDVDALTGGYNLQIAWSTGYAAGKGAANRGGFL